MVFKEYPHSIESEQIVLGGCIAAGVEKPLELGEVLNIVSEEDFFLTKHRVIYKLINRAFSAGSTDVQMLVNEMSEDESKIIGGPAYLVELVKYTPSVMSAKAHAAKVKDLSRRRQLVDLCNSAAQKAGDLHATDIYSLTADLSKNAGTIAGAGIEHPVVSMGEACKKVVERLDSLPHGETGAIPTGWKNLDEYICGMFPGEMTVVAARPSMGKSAFAINMAQNMAARDIPVGFFSLEMSEESIANRIIASETGIDLQLMRRNMLSNDDRRRQKDVLAAISSWPLYIDDTPSINPQHLKTATARMVDQYGVRIIFIDYMQIMMAVSNNTSEYERLSEISPAIKSVARTFNIPVVVLSQLSRSMADGVDVIPGMERLRGSGSIEQDADVILILHRDEYYKPTHNVGMAQVRIAKQRNGPTGVAQLQWSGSLAKFM